MGAPVDQRAVTPNNASKPADSTLFNSPYDFSFNAFLKREYRFGLDPNRPFCKAFREGHCPLGNKCPDKHQISHSFNSLICKHWLRGLCKKGDQCEFLHEYNLRRMPECNHYTRTLYCPNGDECLYLHIDPTTKLTPCPHYDRGFCPLGPRCSQKHARRNQLCRFYLAGFCPYGSSNTTTTGGGANTTNTTATTAATTNATNNSQTNNRSVPTCPEGAHPRWPANLPPPTVKIERTAEQLERERTRIREEGEREEEREWERREGNRREGRGGRDRDGGKGRFLRRKRGGWGA